MQSLSATLENNFIKSDASLDRNLPIPGTNSNSFAKVLGSVQQQPDPYQDLNRAYTEFESENYARESKLSKIATGERDTDPYAIESQPNPPAERSTIDQDVDVQDEMDRRVENDPDKKTGGSQSNSEHEGAAEDEAHHNVQKLSNQASEQIQPESFSGKIKAGVDPESPEIITAVQNVAENQKGSAAGQDTLTQKVAKKVAKKIAEHARAPFRSAMGNKLHGQQDTSEGMLARLLHKSANPPETDVRKAGQKKLKSKIKEPANHKEGLSNSEKNTPRHGLDPAKWYVQQARGLQQKKVQEDVKIDRNLLSDNLLSKTKLQSSASKDQSSGHKQDSKRSFKQNENQAVRSEAIAPDPGSDVEFLERLSTPEGREAMREQNRAQMNELVQKARVNIKSDGSSSAIIRLNPKLLGRVTLNIEMQQNQLSAAVIVDNDTALRLMRDEMEGLKTELQKAGIQIESLTIKVRESSSAFMDMHDDASDNQSELNLAHEEQDESSHKTQDDIAEDLEDLDSLRGSGESAREAYEEPLAVLGRQTDSDHKSLNIIV